MPPLSFSAFQFDKEVDDAEEPDDSMDQDLDNQYCPIRRGPAHFAGNERTKLEKYITAICPTGMYESKSTPHDVFFKHNPDSKARVNLSRFTEKSMPIHVPCAVQTILYEDYVSDTFMHFLHAFMRFCM